MMHGIETSIFSLAGLILCFLILLLLAEVHECNARDTLLKS